MPPVLFIDLVNGTVKEEEIRNKINDLLVLKMQSKENDLKEVDSSLVEYARYWAEHFEQTISCFRPELPLFLLMLWMPFYMTWFGFTQNMIRP